MATEQQAGAAKTDISSYSLNHTMYRIKDPKRSLAFYQNLLGMSIVHTMPVESGKFTNYFLAYGVRKDIASLPKEELMSYLFSLSGVLELCHNWGVEDDDAVSYHNGNKEPQGFGHICICVDDVHAATKRLEDAGTKVLKQPNGGKMKGLAFVTDPDGYWIEIVDKNTSV